MKEILAVALGGAFGALSRYGLLSVFKNLNSFEILAWSLSVNVLGCLALGLLVLSLPADSIFWQRLLVVGFFASFTTFSTYIFEVYSAAETKGLVFALGYFAAQNLLGLLLFFVGLRLARLF